MKHLPPLRRWIVAAFALALFAAGVTVGRLGVVDGAAHAQPAASGLPLAKGASGSSLSWEQFGDTLQMTVTGSEALYLGAAELTDESAWAAHGSLDGKVLHANGTFDLDLSGVVQLTFYRLEPVATLDTESYVFRPCDDPLVDCFPPRPPDDPPKPLTWALFSRE